MDPQLAQGGVARAATHDETGDPGGLVAARDADATNDGEAV